MLGPQLSSLHNLHYYFDLMAQMRAAIEKGELDAHINTIYAGWGEKRPI